MGAPWGVQGPAEQGDAAALTPDAVGSPVRMAGPLWEGPLGEDTVLGACHQGGQSIPSSRLGQAEDCRTGVEHGADPEQLPRARTEPGAWHQRVLHF